jgi:hypothetical protein
MRRIALLAALPLALPAPAAAAGSGGASAPAAEGGASAGGTVLPQPETERTPARRRHEPGRRGAINTRGPVLAAFQVTRPRLFLYGRPARVLFRIDARSRTVRVRLYVIPRGERTPASTIFLGERRTGTTQSTLITGLEGGVLPEGRYAVRIAARDPRGRHLRRGAASSVAQELSFSHHRFPLVGPFTYGGPDARFGAPRRGHSHQGQDLPAAEGTPVVAPRGGTVKAVQYQARGAGHYVVLDGDGEDRDYVFMHLRSGSIVVHEGQHVRTGQRLGDVGSTGESSGPHLHFEIWVGGGWYTGGHPVDPLPFLRSWSR